jgi:hypothetical protein
MKTGTQDCGRWREAIRLRICGALEGEEAVQLKTHLAGCAECHLYAEEVQAATDSLRWLGSRDVEPRPGFRARWTRAVEEAARPSGIGETAAALVVWWRGLLLRNLRPALGMAFLWILALLFRFSAPEVAPSAQMTAARSPVEIFRALGADKYLLARQFFGWDAVRVAPRKSESAQPRGEGPPTQPAAHWEHEAGTDVAFGELFPNFIAQLPV